MHTEYSTVNLSRSKSHDDLNSMLDPEMSHTCDFSRRTLIRQGAIRKRVPDIEIDLHKRNSVFVNKNEFTVAVSIFDNQLQCNLDKDSQKRTKNSLTSFAIVKEKWKSLKRDSKANAALEKEEAKKKISEMNINTKTISESQPEIFSPDINVFLPKSGTKVNLSYEDPIILIDSSWEVLVDNTKTMTKTEFDCQAAIWEIIETEVNLIKQLSVLVHVFYPLLQNLLINFHSELLGIEIEEVFGNINEVYQSHVSLWSDCISLPLSTTKLRKEPLDVRLMKKGFCNISKTLSSYVHLMRRLPTMRQTIGKLSRKSCVFRQYIEWTQQYSRLCRDGHLCILSLPFQRITRYKLLLERVKSLLSREEQPDIDEMMSSVHIFLQQMDSSIIGKYSMKDLKEKIVETNPFKEYFSDLSKIVNEENLQFDIMRPLSGYHERILIHEGHLKLKESCNKSSDVQCYLCNDLFMVCKPIKGNWEKLKICKAPIRLDKLLVKDRSEGCLVIIVYNDFKVVESTILLTGPGEEIKLWVDKCNKTRSTFMSQFTEQNMALFCSKRSSFEAVVSSQDHYSSNESLGILKHSETNSSGYSTYSTDSTFSQASNCSTQTDFCCFEHKRLGDSEICISKSVENLTTMNGISNKPDLEEDAMEDDIKNHLTGHM